MVVIILTEVMMASSNDDRFHWHFTAGESTDSSISSMASATYVQVIDVPAMYMITCTVLDYC